MAAAPGLPVQAPSAVAPTSAAGPALGQSQAPPPLPAASLLPPGMEAIPQPAASAVAAGGASAASVYLTHQSGPTAPPRPPSAYQASAATGPPASSSGVGPGASAPSATATPMWPPAGYPTQQQHPTTAAVGYVVAAQMPNALPQHLHPSHGPGLPSMQPTIAGPTPVLFAQQLLSPKAAGYGVAQPLSPTYSLPKSPPPGTYTMPQAGSSFQSPLRTMPAAAAVPVAAAAPSAPASPGFRRMSPSAQAGAAPSLPPAHASLLGSRYSHLQAAAAPAGAAATQASLGHLHAPAAVATGWPAVPGLTSAAGPLAIPGQAQGPGLSTMGGAPGGAGQQQANVPAVTLQLPNAPGSLWSLKVEGDSLQVLQVRREPHDPGSRPWLGLGCILW